jgi:glycosyltransferase involved in cell wall biosynthesis
LIAGAGIKKSLFGKNIPKNVHQIDKWLTEAEIWGLIENSKGLILLYEEATQSGVAAIAINLGIPVLSTNVGGLKEQLEGVPNAIVVENNISDIKQGILEFGKDRRMIKNNLETNSPMEISLRILEELCERK